MQRVKLRLADLKWMMGCCFRDVWPMISACETLLGTNKAPVGVAGCSLTHDTASVVGIFLFDANGFMTRSLRFQAVTNRDPFSEIRSGKDRLCLN